MYYLYRHFDKDGVLLYVGISISVIVRLSSHAASSLWFDNISKIEIEIEKFNTKKEALYFEKIAIAKENPLHNKY